MRLKNYLSESHLMAVVIILLSSFLSISCDKDDDNDPSQLVGRWELTWMDGVTTESYYFDEAGWGSYDGDGVTGSFNYTIDSPGSIHFKIVYQKWIGGNGTWKDEFTWPYSIRGDKLTLDGKTYTRQIIKGPLELQ